MKRRAKAVKLTSQELALQKKVFAFQSTISPAKKMTYPESFHDEVKAIVNTGVSLARLAKIMKISNKTLRAWSGKYPTPPSVQYRSGKKRRSQVRQLYLEPLLVADQPMKILLTHGVVLEIPMGGSIEWVRKLVTLGAS